MMAVDRELCEACGACVGVCQADAIVMCCDCIEIRNEVCTLCRSCEAVCPVGAIVFEAAK